MLFAVFCGLRVCFAALYFTQLSRHLHRKMLAAVLRQSMVWYAPWRWNDPVEICVVVRPPKLSVLSRLFDSKDNLRYCLSNSLARHILILSLVIAIWEHLRIQI